MTAIELEGARAGNPPSVGLKLYFAAWRWHFYAGLFVIPFMAMLAVTGLIILWFTAVAPEYGDRLAVVPGASVLSLPEQEAAALAAYPGASVSQYIAPIDAAKPALFRVDAAPGAQSGAQSGARMIALDPYRGTVLRDRARGDTWNEFATDIHGTLLIGDTGDRLIEIAAGLGLVLVTTGLYLAWPRGPGGWARTLVPDLGARGRALWKSLHGVIGFWMALVLIFFLISGLAWAGIWGGKFVQAWSTFPAAKWDDVPLSDMSHAALNRGAEKSVPWAIEQTPMPASGSGAGVAGVAEGAPVDLAAVVALGRTLGFAGRFQVAAPQGETGVWTLSQDSMSYDSPDPTADRTVHVDRYSGRVLASVGFADYSLPGKAMAVGIALHEGQMGAWNIALNLAFAGSILFIALSGAVMWWKRRPEGGLRLAAPPLPEAVPMWKGAVLIALLLAMAFALRSLFLRLLSASCLFFLFCMEGLS
ncbi:MAG: PepSY domain-containing protein [Alphaproteobacteria bacterium HGW-Alphaproteobacteria-5]|nr:MAG: PepSY domain-containing protein [Alphaproteobacteria bacterium HGW-Alphaproteobacteria-5]